MCIYTVKEQNKIKNSQGGVRNSTKRLKTRRLRRKDTAKTNKD